MKQPSTQEPSAGYRLEKDSYSYNLNIEADTSSVESMRAALERLISLMDNQAFIDTIYSYSPEWYYGLYENDAFEGVNLFREACEHEELRPLAAKFGEKVAETDENYSELTCGEYYVGNDEITTLCLADKLYIPLYIRYLHAIDLGNENGQDESIYDIEKKWGWCAETAPLFAARFFSLDGQNGREQVVDLLQNGGSEALAHDPMLLDKFLEAVATEVKVELETYRCIDEVAELFEAAFTDDEDHEALAERLVCLVEKGKTPTFALLKQEEEPEVVADNWADAIPTTPEEAFETETLANGALRIKKFKDAYKEAKDIAFPATINGIKVEEIGNAVCYQNETLERVVIPENIKAIDIQAFQMCKRLHSVALPNSLQSIGENTFAYCYQLKTIRLPEQLENIDDYAFSCCESLPEIYLPDSLKNTDAYGIFQFCKKLTHTRVPSSWTEIPPSMFNDCKSIVEIQFPPKLNKIGRNVFYGCKQLKEVSLPESIREICSSAFQECSALKSITIPSPVMVKLEATKVNFTTETREVMWVFKSISPEAVFKVPAALVDEYATVLNKDVAEKVQVEII